MEAVENWRGEGDPFQYTAIWDNISSPLSQVISGQEGAAAAMDEIATVIQAQLDDLFKQ